ILLGLIGCSLVATGQTTNTTPTPYQVCKGWFALCTMATCGTQTGPNGYTCTQCYVLNGSSVASAQPANSACMAVSNPPQANQEVQSRFAVMNGVKIINCDIPRPWANCLNAKCTVDSNTQTNKTDTPTATCTCPLNPPTPYVSGSGQQGCSGTQVISSESQT